MTPSANGMYVALADYEALVRKFEELTQQAEYLLSEVEQGKLSASDAQTGVERQRETGRLRYQQPLAVKCQQVVCVAVESSHRCESWRAGGRIGFQSCGGLDCVSRRLACTRRACAGSPTNASPRDERGYTVCESATRARHGEWIRFAQPNTHRWRYNCTSYYRGCCNRRFHFRINRPTERNDHLPRSVCGEA